MPKKKFIAFIVSYSTNKHFRSFVGAHYFFINKISQLFNNTYIINLNNLNFFTKSKIFKSTVLKDYGLEKKIKFFFPNLPGCPITLECWNRNLGARRP